MYKSVSFSSFGSTETSNIENWRNKIEVTGFPQVNGRKGAITLKYRPIIIAAFVIFAVLLIYTYVSTSNLNADGLYAGGKTAIINQYTQQQKLMFYNKTYPLTKPISTSTGATFRIGLITDMDTESKVKTGSWRSILLYGNLTYNQHSQKLSVSWGKHDIDNGGVELTSSYAYKGRGMELSDLIVYNARVFTVDDRTGIIYEIVNNKAVPWVILSDGDGKQTKGFKGEWMAVKDEKLFIGGLGKEWTTTDGEYVHSYPQWIKSISKDRSVTDLDWISNYKAMQRASGYESPGYIIHESAVWSDVHRAWFFLPRRASHLKYDEELDEQRATNLLFRCSEDFSEIKVTKIGNIDYPARGYSSFKFVPGTKDNVVVALKTEEVKGQTRSYITAFSLDGEILMTDTLVSQKYKYEGVEFL